jgi:hypothetical protein
VFPFHRVPTQHAKPSKPTSHQGYNSPSPREVHSIPPAQSTATPKEPNLNIDYKSQIWDSVAGEDVRFQRNSVEIARPSSMDPDDPHQKVYCHFYSRATNSPSTSFPLGGNKSRDPEGINSTRHRVETTMLLLESAELRLALVSASTCFCRVECLIRRIGTF